jgi:hypothetical protein
VNLDSGLEVKASDSGSDSENNEILTSDLWEKVDSERI